MPTRMRTTATRGFYVDRDDYNYYFREGFRRGYEDGYNGRYQYGTYSGRQGLDSGRRPGVPFSTSRRFALAPSCAVNERPAHSRHA